MVAFYAGVVPRIENTTEYILILTISLVVQVLSIILMMVTSTTNPGIIPKMELDATVL